MVGPMEKVQLRSFFLSGYIKYNLPSLVVKNSYFDDVIGNHRLITCAAWYQHLACPYVYKSVLLIPVLTS